MVAVLLVGLLIANVLNIAADLVAIGAGVSLLHGGPADTVGRRRRRSGSRFWS